MYFLIMMLSHLKLKRGCCWSLVSLSAYCGTLNVLWKLSLLIMMERNIEASNIFESWNGIKLNLFKKKSYLVFIPGFFVKGCMFKNWIDINYWTNILSSFSRSNLTLAETLLCSFLLEEARYIHLLNWHWKIGWANSYSLFRFVLAVLLSRSPI